MREFLVYFDENGLQNSGNNTRKRKRMDFREIMNFPAIEVLIKV